MLSLPRDLQVALEDALGPRAPMWPTVQADASRGDGMTVKRMDNVGIVVEDIDAAVAFFTELGLEL